MKRNSICSDTPTDLTPIKGHFVADNNITLNDIAVGTGFCLATVDNTVDVVNETIYIKVEPNTVYDINAKRAQKMDSNTLVIPKHITFEEF